MEQKHAIFFGVLNNVHSLIQAKRRLLLNVYLFCAEALRAPK